MSHANPGGTPADRDAAEAVRQHHAELAREIDQRVESLMDSVENQLLAKADQTRQDLLDFLREQLVPHARAEEEALYPAAATGAGGPLITGMLTEHQAIRGLVEELDSAASAARAAAAGRALSAMFAVHLAKENDLVLPMLLAAPEVSVADLLAGMHELLGAEEAR